MSEPMRQRVDVWLWHARFTKTRAGAARLVSEGGVRLLRNGSSRQLEKPASEVQAGDMLMFPLRGGFKAVKVEAIGLRRGPAPEARGLYSELDADAFA